MITGWVRKARELARDFQSGLDDLARETEIDKVSDEIRSGLGVDDLAGSENSIRKDLEDAIDPDGEMRDVVNEAISPLDEDDPLVGSYVDDDEDIDASEPSETEAAELEKPGAGEIEEEMIDTAREPSAKETVGVAKKA